jgi:hypothetical protein
VGEFLERVRLTRLIHDNFRVLALDLRDCAFCAVVSSNSISGRLAEITNDYAKLEKYRRQSVRAMGFGIILGDSKPFEYCTSIENTWQRDSSMAQRLRECRPRRLDHPPTRNDLCPCGTGKKFKKCCADSSVPLSNTFSPEFAKKILQLH